MEPDILIDKVIGLFQQGQTKYLVKGLLGWIGKFPKLLNKASKLIGKISKNLFNDHFGSCYTKPLDCI